VGADQDGAGWCAVFTNPASEDAVAARLRRDGLRTFLPKYRKILRGIRIVSGRRVRTKGPGEIVLRPLFSRYLFVELYPEQGWHGIATAPGVARLVMHTRDVGSPPALIHPEVIEAIREAVDRGDFDQARQTAPMRVDLKRMLDAGEQPRVKINGHDIIGELLALDDQNRAAVLVELFNRPMVTRVDAGPLTVVVSD